MADAAQANKGGSGSRALLWLVILALLGAVWWLASERNARKFTLSSRGAALVVSRGHYFPTGTSAIGEGDALGKLYAGLALPMGAKNIPETEYDDQGELDRALYELLSNAAHALAKKGDATAYAEADSLAKRLSLLPGLTAEDHSDLNSLRAELAFWSAGGDVQAALTALTAARRKLEEARANAGEHAPLAGGLAEHLDVLSARLAAFGACFVAGAALSPHNAADGRGPESFCVQSNLLPAPTPVAAAPIAASPVAAAPVATAPLADGGSAMAAPATLAEPPAAAPSPASAIAPAAVKPQSASAPSSISSGASRAR